MQRVCQRGALVKMSQDISQLWGTGKQGTAECHACQHPCRRDQDIKQRTTATTSIAGKYFEIGITPSQSNLQQSLTERLRLGERKF